MTGKEHNRLLSIFLLIQGGLQLFGGLFMGLVYGGMGIAFLSASSREEEQVAGGIILALALIVVPLVLIFAGIFLTAGWKMLKEKGGARTWGIAACIVALFGFPLGTALGIYGLWFLFGEEGKRFYGQGGANNFSSHTPGGWQS